MDSAWASRNRTRLTFVLVTALFIFLIVYIAIKTYAPPTCFDTNRNQGEQGVDCGGPCSLLCPFQTKSMDVMWTRLFEVSPGIFSAVAYVQNSNYGAFTKDARYRFTFYDSAGRKIGEREGTTFVGGEPALAVIESKIQIENNEPRRASFEWLDKPTYYAYDQVHGVGITEHETLTGSVGIEVRATLRNEQPVAAQDVEVALVVFDASENAIAASKTYVDYIAPRSTRAISFTWPNPFPAQPSRLEFIPRIPVQD